MSVHRYEVEVEVHDDVYGPHVPPEEWTVRDLETYLDTGKARLERITYTGERTAP